MEKHYMTVEASVDFLGMFEADSFDEEREEAGVWQGLVYNDDTNEMEVYAEFVWDKDADSGTGWWL